MDLDYDNKPGKKIVPRVYYPKCRCGERASPGFKTCRECRLYQRTRPEESAIVEDMRKRIKGSIQHNVIDAICLGLWIVYLT